LCASPYLLQIDDTCLHASPPTLKLSAFWQNSAYTAGCYTFSHVAWNKDPWPILKWKSSWDSKTFSKKTSFWTQLIHLSTSVTRWQDASGNIDILFPHMKVCSPQWTNRGRVIVPHFPVSFESVIYMHCQDFGARHSWEVIITSLQISTNGWIAFASDSDSQIEVMQKCKVLHRDGTFRATPSLFSQVYLKCGYVGGKGMPFWFVLMQNPTLGSYRSLFHVLRHQTRVVTGEGLNPEQIVIDFEKAAQTAAEEFSFTVKRHKVTLKHIF
jgi:hypothetical protein